MIRLARPLAVGAVAVMAWGAVSMPTADATPDPGTLVGEGGSFAEPLIVQLINDASPELAPEYAGYATLDVNSGQAGFADGDEDFAVSEFPLSAANQAEAASIGRSYVYFPFAAIPVAIGVDLLTQGDSENTPSSSSSFFQDMQFSQHQLFCIFVTACGATTFFPLGRDWDSTPDLADTSAANAAACAAANDPNDVTCQQLPVFDTEGGSQPITVDLPEEPDASIAALSNLFANDPTSKAQWDAWSQGEPLVPGTPSNPVSEIWPAPAGNGDDGVVERSLFPSDPNLTNGTTGPIDEYSIYPTVFGYEAANGSIAPLPNDWVAPFIPTAKVENAAGDYVAASTSSAEASLSDASLGSNNIVSFPEDDPNPASYPMTVMSYLVLPTSGVPAAKFTAIAQLLQFVLSVSGAADIEASGSAPITATGAPQIYAADEQIVTEMQTLAANASLTSSVSTSTTTTATPTSTTAAPTTTTVYSSTTTSTPVAGYTPAGFTAEGVSTVGSKGGSLVGTAGSTRIEVDVPPGAVSSPTQVEIASALTSSAKIVGDSSNDKTEAVVAVTLARNGTALTGAITPPVKVTLESLAIAPSASLYVYDSTKKAYAPANASLGITSVSASTGIVTFDGSAVSQVALVEPPATPVSVAPKPGAATATTTTTIATSGTNPESGGSGGSSGSTVGSGGGTLAFTGSNPVPLVAASAILIVGGEVVRRKRRNALRRLPR